MSFTRVFDDQHVHLSQRLTHAWSDAEHQPQTVKLFRTKTFTNIILRVQTIYKVRLRDGCSDRRFNT